MRFWKRIAAASAAAAVASTLGLLLVLLPASGADEIDQEVPGPLTGFTLFADLPLQSFEPAQSTIRAAEVYLQAEDFEGTFDGTTVNLEVRTSTNVLIGSATQALPANFTGGWLLLNFGSSLPVVPNDTYILKVYLTGSTPVDQDLGWASDGSSSYGRGAGTINGASVANLDFLFRTYYDDPTPPVITYTLTPAMPGSGGWYKAPVTITWNVSDPDSDFTEFGCVDQTVSGPSAMTNYGCTATSSGGTTVAPTVSFGIDLTKPVITGSRDVLPNVNGWNNTSVTVTFSCTDAGGSGIATNTVTVPQTLSADGANQSVSNPGTCIDNAGNVADAATVSGINIDKAKPTITAAATTSPNGAGWYNQAVTVHFTCNDALSNIPPGNCPADWTSTGQGSLIPSPALTVTDAAGNPSLPSNVLTFNIDTTAPIVTLVPSPLSPNANGWYKTDVTVDTQGSDSGSGLTDTNCTPDQPVGETGIAGLNIVGSCTDVAGNVGNAGPLNIKVDKTFPTTTLNVTGTLGANGWYTSNVTVTPSGADGLSGIDFCDAPANLSSDTAGTLVTLSCTDKAGNVTSASTTIKIDQSAPSASMSVIFGTVGLNGWYRSAVIVAATGADTISGPVDCTPALQNLGVETAGTTLNATCTNQAGLPTPTSIIIKIDFTGPTVTLTPSGTAGDNGWFTSVVTVDTSGTDALAGIVDADCTANQVIPGDTAGTVVAGSCKDLAGNTSGTAIVVKVDTTDPSATMTVTGGSLGDNGWYTSDVSVSTTATDNVSGPVVCTPPNETLSTETGLYTFESICTNQAGLWTKITKDVKLDKTAPEVDIVFLNGAPNANGWSRDDVFLQANAVDPISGPAVCVWTPGPTVTLETAGQLVSVTCTNAAGLATTESVLVKLDLSDPVADILVVDGVEGDNGWYTTTVTAEAFGSDSISGPVVCVPQLQQQATETDGTDLEAVCTNQAGLETPVLVNVKVDKTPPTNVELAVTAGTLGNNGWYKSDVTVETTSDDETVSDPVTCTPDQFQTTDTTGQVFNGSCTNDAGLTADAAPLTVKLDKTPPTLTPTVPAAIGQASVAAATPNATDATSGIASQSCGALVTTTLGTFSTTCTATDNAGNTTTVNVSYQVISTTGDCGKILFGTVPPPGGGVGTFAFSCGSIAQLIAVTGCSQATMTIYYNKAGGGYMVYIPASTVTAVNQEFVTTFNGNPQIPVNTIFSVKCV